jgi:hypothetical protein
VQGGSSKPAARFLFTDRVLHRAVALFHDALKQRVAQRREMGETRTAQLG